MNLLKDGVRGSFINLVTLIKNDYALGNTEDKSHIVVNDY
jgi:hypothetical protein